MDRDSLSWFMAGLFLRLPHSRATRTESSILKTPLLRSSQRIQEPWSCGEDKSSLRNCHRCMCEPPLPPERLEGTLAPLLLLVVGSDSSSSSSETCRIPSDQPKTQVIFKQRCWTWLTLLMVGLVLTIWSLTAQYRHDQVKICIFS